MWDELNFFKVLLLFVVLLLGLIGYLGKELSAMRIYLKLQPLQKNILNFKVIRYFLMNNNKKNIKSQKVKLSRCLIAFIGRCRGMTIIHISEKQ
ncbi:hypothetical protein WQ57_09850 [Mesobacillus campisalis]|uniref:Uncharacterized protein n=1 Tax=Mesobacillus campisalis TaxID=1408103 RepID=A0A0M2SU59_9BACI|nr:hypothetical protein WQ57_09850 [Mesobacillus campisalis]